jgi:hypothetical protein
MTARATVKPPKPESNIPIGRSTAAKASAVTVDRRLVYGEPGASLARREDDAIVLHHCEDEQQRQRRHLAVVTGEGLRSRH